MGDVYGNVNVNYSYCKSVAQLKSAADYILGRRKEQVEDGVVKTEPHLYKAFGCNRDNFANSLLITRKMHDKRYSRYKQKEILAQKLSISFHPEDNDGLSIIWHRLKNIIRQYGYYMMWISISGLSRICMEQRGSIRLANMQRQSEVHWHH